MEKVRFDDGLYAFESEKFELESVEEIRKKLKESKESKNYRDLLKYLEEQSDSKD